MCVCVCVCFFFLVCLLAADVVGPPLLAPLQVLAIVVFVVGVVVVVVVVVSQQVLSLVGVFKLHHPSNHVAVAWHDVTRDGTHRPSGRP